MNVLRANAALGSRSQPKVTDMASSRFPLTNVSDQSPGAAPRRGCTN
ncbi:MAG: hypothetical protein QOF95_2235 [Pseudonocardiales bacterium]|jgi:hypothetical protein|nr:hypothetical protein [Pseudonocardiales bacterium]MDT4984745.1 hypothetical protein [Pseudonocardiales bacterium]